MGERKLTPETEAMLATIRERSKDLLYSKGVELSNTARSYSIANVPTLDFILAIDNAAKYDSKLSLFTPDKNRNIHLQLWTERYNVPISVDDWILKKTETRRVAYLKIPKIGDISFDTWIEHPEEGIVKFGSVPLTETPLSQILAALEKENN